jgi:hypothetical protein
MQLRPDTFKGPLRKTSPAGASAGPQIAAGKSLPLCTGPKHMQYPFKTRAIRHPRRSAPGIGWVLGQQRLNLIP